MKKLNEFIDKYYRKVFFFLLVVIFVNTCGNPNKSVNKRLDKPRPSTVFECLATLREITKTKKAIQIGIYEILSQDKPLIYNEVTDEVENTNLSK